MKECEAHRQKHTSLSSQVLMALVNGSIVALSSVTGALRKTVDLPGPAARRAREGGSSTVNSACTFLHDTGHTQLPNIFTDLSALHLAAAARRRSGATLSATCLSARLRLGTPTEWRTSLRQ